VSTSCVQVPASVDAALDRLPQLRPPRRVEALPGGLTNRNYKVSTEQSCYVARFSSSESELLGVDRAAEHYNSLVAAEKHVGPAVVGFLPADGALVISWLDGRTLNPGDLTAEVLERVATTCRRLHEGTRFVNDFNMFALQRRYLELVQERGFRLPPGYLDLAVPAGQIASAFAIAPAATVPCHNDLLSSNMIDDGHQIWLIDFEYSGNNDPAFELGNIWSEADLSLDALECLVTSYDPRAGRAALSRARLWGLMAKYGWMLWASIQDAVSDIDFDFWSWGLEKYERAVAEFHGPDFERLLSDVAQTAH
jgi:thiamine kinase-like enzyme